MSIDVFPLLKSAIKVILSCSPVLIVLLLVFAIIYCIKNKVHVKFKTFIKKGFRPVRGDFGLFVYCGSQGSEKVKHIL